MTSVKAKQEDDQPIVDAYKKGVSTASLSAESGVCQNVICKVLKRNGVSFRGGRQLSDEEERMVCAEFDPNEWGCFSRLARKYGVGRGVVYGALNRAGIIKGKIRGHGIAAPNDVVETLKDLYEGGKTLKEVAVDVGRSASWVRRQLINAGVTLRPKVKRPLLTPSHEEELCRLYQEERLSYVDLTERFGVSGDFIGKLLKRHGIQPRSGWSEYATKVWMDRKGREHRFKSSWEMKYAEHLDERGVDWAYEAEKFPLGGECKVYTPDFWIYDDGELSEIIEVKGMLDLGSAKRVLAFVIKYPKLAKSLRIVGPRELAELGLIPSWNKTSKDADKASALGKTVKSLAEGLSRLKKAA